MKNSLPLSSIKIDDPFWNRYTALIPEKVIPYQWEILNDRITDAPPSHCLKNFRIAAGEEKGQRHGMVFQDSDAAKWLEAVAYSLAVKPDPELEKTADEVIALIGRAQEADGYLNTYYTLNAPNGKWKNLTEGHELYCAGHFIEAAVAYYETTGKKPFLEIICRLADLICKIFGSGEGQIRGYPGHPEVELALVKLYHATGVKRYLETAYFFINERGKTPNYLHEEMKKKDFKPIWSDASGFDPFYSQTHLPVREQTTAEGHAVRALYLYSAMADLAGEYKDSELLKTCVTLWENIVHKRMYITGSIGSSGHLERFTVDYDLPNDSNYSETCASIALAMFGRRMAEITGDASYFDTVERALYNTIRAGISMEGDRYFYVNPLEVWPETCMEKTSRAHVKAVRQKWFDCACCPTNVARTFTNLGSYIYIKNNDELFVNLFIQNQISFEINGKTVNLSLKTDYPQTGKVKISVNGNGASFPLNIRIPGYADEYKVMLNGSPARGFVQNNYFIINREWNDEEIEIDFPLKPRIVYSNPKAHHNCGRTAISRGPEVYCLEECDNGKNLAALSIDTQSELKTIYRKDLIGGTMQIIAKGKRSLEPPEPESFSEKFIPRKENTELVFTPYGSWGNRAVGEMTVWVRSE